MTVKKFVFLFPEKRIFDFEIGKGCNGFYRHWDRERGYLFEPEKAESEAEKLKIQKVAFEDLKQYFRPFYTRKLNSCIDHRHRKKGFQVVFATFSSDIALDVVDIKPEDEIIYARQKGKGGYPDNDFMLEQLQPLEILRIGGFHMWDCVSKFAKHAHKRGIDTLVDEDLTEFFAYRVCDWDFKVKHSNYKPKKSMREMFMEARKGKPWLWQDY